MLRIETVGGVFEVWLFTDSGDRTPVTELGLATTQAEADHLAACLKYWLHFSVFGRRLREAVPSSLDRAALLLLPESLWERGIDPASVRVRGVRRGHESDNHVIEPEELPDTDLLAPGEVVLSGVDDAA